MGNKIFRTEKDIDMIIDFFTKDKAKTMADLCNESIRKSVMPCYFTKLNKMAKMLLENENVDQRTIRCYLSEGVILLAKRHIRNTAVVEQILAHYDDSTYENRNMVLTEVQKKIIDKAYERLRIACAASDGIYETRNFIVMAKQLLNFWEKVYDYSSTYEAISCGIYLCDSKIPFSRMEAVMLLKEIEETVIDEYLNPYDMYVPIAG